MARAGTEFLTSNTAIAYPFQASANGLARNTPVTYGTDGNIPGDVFVDASATVKKDRLQLYLNSITPVSGNHEFSFWDQDEEVFVGTITAADLTSGTWFIRLKFTNADSEAITLVFEKSGIKSYLAGLVTTTTFTTTLPLEHTVLIYRSRKVLSFTLLEDLTDPPAVDDPGPIDGSVLLDAGYNIDLRSANKDITITAAAGAGEGTLPCIEADTLVNPTVPGLVPDEGGNVVIAPGDGCFDVNLIGTDTLQVSGSCEACCSCGDYESVAKAEEVIHQKLAATYEFLVSLKDMHNYYVTEYNKYIEGNFVKRTLRVYGLGGAAVSTGGDELKGIVTPRSQYSIIRVTAVFTNTYSCPVTLNSIILDYPGNCIPPEEEPPEVPAVEVTSIYVVDHYGNSYSTSEGALENTEILVLPGETVIAIFTVESGGPTITGTGKVTVGGTFDEAIAGNLSLDSPTELLPPLPTAPPSGVFSADTISYPSGLAAPFGIEYLPDLCKNRGGVRIPTRLCPEDGVWCDEFHINAPVGPLRVPLGSGGPILIDDGGIGGGPTFGAPSP